MLLWSSAFETGHPAIDAQHRTLFQRVHDLRVAVYERHGEQEMRRVLSSVSVYVGVHFRMEEGLMDMAGYPGLEAHRAAHDKLRTKAEALVDRFKEGGLQAEDLLAFLERWLTAHVLEDDQEMVAFLNARAEGEASA